jgi:hypothetical protein
VDRPAAEAIYDALTADLSVIEDRDPEDITEREFDKAMAAYWNIVFLNAGYRRGQLR